MYLCRMRFREAISEISFNTSTICINYQLQALRERLTRVTNDFLGDFGPLLPQFDGERSRPCSQGMTRSQKPEDSHRGKMGPFLFDNEVPNILWKPLLSLFTLVWWCRVLLKRSGMVFEVLSRATMHWHGCHIDNSAGSILLLHQQKIEDFFRTLLRLPRPSLRPDLAS